MCYEAPTGGPLVLCFLFPLKTTLKDRPLVPSFAQPRTTMPTFRTVPGIQHCLSHVLSQG